MGIIVIVIYIYLINMLLKLLVILAYKKQFIFIFKDMPHSFLAIIVICHTIYIIC